MHHVVREWAQSRLRLHLLRQQVQIYVLAWLLAKLDCEEDCRISTTQA